MKAKYQKLANEYVVSLFPAFTLPMGIFVGTKKFLSCPVIMAFKIENNACEWYFLPENWKQAHLKLAAKIKNNPDFLTFAYSQMVSLAKRQIKFAKSIRGKLNPSSNNQLVKYYQQFIKYNIELYQFGLLLPLLDYNDLTFLSDELHQILKSKNADKYFNLLTIPHSQTTVKRQELDLLIILQELLKQTELKKLFAKEKPVQIVESLKQKHRPFWKDIEKHTKKYTWAYYVYEGPAVNEQYFIEILQDWVKRKVDPKKQLIQNQKFASDAGKRQRAVLAKLKLNKYEKQILDLTQDVVFIKPYRRELQSCSYYYIEPLLSEIAQRLHLSLKQIRMLLPSEVKSALLREKDYLGVINERQKLLLYNYWPKQFCLSGQKARSYVRKNVIQEKINLKTEIFSGTTAFGGKVKGWAKIINAPNDMEKMEEGDILVALTTNPNLMPAIRMAKAIVTEEGGLTCHAAIVARELRIPCVVGARGAAHVLKDGDKVEVDANKGIIRKI